MRSPSHHLRRPRCRLTTMRRHRHHRRPTRKASLRLRRRRRPLTTTQGRHRRRPRPRIGAATRRRRSTTPRMRPTLRCARRPGTMWARGRAPTNPRPPRTKPRRRRSRRRTPSPRRADGTNAGDTPSHTRSIGSAAAAAEAAAGEAAAGLAAHRRRVGIVRPSTFSAARNGRTARADASWGGDAASRTAMRSLLLLRCASGQRSKGSATRSEGGRLTRRGARSLIWSARAARPPPTMRG